jgi:hypothetical protein
MAIALLLPFGAVMTAPGAASAQDDRTKALRASSAHDDDDSEDQDLFRGRNEVLRGRWDLARILPGTLTAATGGTGTASAENGSRITLTGGGTFNLPSGRVTGGGTWQTKDASGAITGSGWYRVRSLVSWNVSPGSLTCPPFGDTIGNCEDARGGVLVLVIDYSDGTEGVLTFSCRLFGAPDSMYEGISTTKGFVHYWKHEKVNQDDSNCFLHVRSRG